LSVEELRLIQEQTWVTHVLRYEERGIDEPHGQLGRDSTESFKPILVLAKTLIKKPILIRSTSRRTLSLSAIQNNYYRTWQNRKIQYATVTLSMLLSFGITGTAEFDRQQQLKQINKQKDKLLNAMGAIENDVHKISTAGQQMSHALRSRLALEQSYAEQPVVLLNMLGGIFSAHRELILSELQWVIVDSPESQSLNAQGTDMFSPNYRAQHSLEQVEPSVVIVGLTGYGAPGMSLRQQQEATESIVTSLRGIEYVSHLKLEHSPVAQAAQRGETVLNADAIATTFSIRFQLNRAIVNET